VPSTILVTILTQFSSTSKELAGELNIKSCHEELWQTAKGNPEDIVHQICAVEGNHTDEIGDNISLCEDDVIVQHCAWHYGRKDENPLSAVRFVNREELDHGEEILTAHEVDEDDYETIIPTSFMKRCIRVYSRNPSKTDLLLHKFQTWKENLSNDAPSPMLNTQANPAILQEATAEVSVLDRAYASAPVPLTQDSDDEADMYTPIKNRIQQQKEDPSPIPLPSFRLFK
jgi:hypothetical protein